MMPNTQEHSERIAVLETNATNTNEKIEKLASAVTELSKEVRTLSDTMQRVKGGWWVLASLGTISGAFGAFVAWAFTHVSFKIGG